MRRRYVCPVLLLAVAVLVLWKTGGAAAQGAAARTPKAAAPIDLTGYWVSVITEDWRWRMVTPAKGDYASIPITREAESIADQWDPAKEEASGEPCKGFGAGAIMRVPGRLHITWQDEVTLKVEIDAGTQTRLFHFGAWQAPAGEATWQGDSVAQWESAAPRADGATFGTLKVVTTHFRPGYVRKNGVPYSGNAVLTEYWDLNVEKNGERWLIVTSILHDPQFLRFDFLTSPNFKKEPNGAKWDPTPCTSLW